MFKRKAVFVTLLATALANGAVQAGNYLDDIARLDAQIAIQRKQIEARDLAIQAAGRVSLPTVRYVSGFDDDLSAVVTYGNGRKITVKRGDQLPGGIEVKGVRQNGVQVSLGKQVTLLEFSVSEDALNGGASREQPSGLIPPLPQVSVPLPGSVGQVQPPLPQPLQGGRATGTVGSLPDAGRVQQSSTLVTPHAAGASAPLVSPLAAARNVPAAVATAPAPSVASAAAPRAQAALAIGRATARND